MRHILVDRARQKHSRKRGGERIRVELDEANLAAVEDSEEVLAVDEALAGLAAADAQAADLVKLRYFAGLSIPEAAHALNISPRSADRLWAYARAWLRRAIDGACHLPAGPCKIGTGEETWRDPRADCACTVGGHLRVLSRSF